MRADELEGDLSSVKLPSNLHEAINLRLAGAVSRIQGARAREHPSEPHSPSPFRNRMSGLQEECTANEPHARGSPVSNTFCLRCSAVREQDPGLDLLLRLAAVMGLALGGSPWRKARI